MNKISLKSYLSSLLVIFILMILTLILTMVIPSGQYQRVVDANGNSIIDTTSGFSFIESSFPFYKWLLSPFLVLTVDGGITIILIIVFLFIIGGVSSLLESQGLVKYMVNKLVYKYGDKRYLVLALITLIFMLLGSFIGTFEEVVPLVPIVISLVVMLGFDNMVGIAISLIAVASGFASGILNPFTIGVAQSLANLPMFSGVWLRVVSFVLIYALLLSFILIYAKKIAKDVNKEDINFISDKKMDKALLSFVVILGTGIVLIISSTFIKSLQDYTMVICAVSFLLAGVVSSIVSGITLISFFKEFASGALAMAPATLMILMASSIKYCLVEANILDTLMYYLLGVSSNFPKYGVVLFIYLIVLIMNFFVASGSAKAFLLIPLIVPIASVLGISAQLCVLAFAFGDGFSNVFYPTNPVLLISLGVSDTSYVKYVKFSWPYQLVNLVLTSGILLFGLAIGY